MGKGRRIKEVRLLLNLKQTELASQMKISSSYLSSVESEIKEANATILLTLINEYDVNPEWLEKGSGEMFSDKGDCVFIKTIESSEKDQKHTYPMSKDFVEHELDSVGEELVVYHVRNDNMFPTLQKGDAVLVNKTDNTSESEGIFLFENEDRKFIRRLVIVPEKHLVNDNNNMVQGAILLNNAIKCIGRIVWFSRKI